MTKHIALSLTLYLGMFYGFKVIFFLNALPWESIISNVIHEEWKSSFFIFFVELNKGSNQLYSEALLNTNIVPMYQSFQGKKF